MAIQTNVLLRNVASITTTAENFRIVDGNYTLSIASTENEFDAALKLRFEVFNLELDEGLQASYINERDQDSFDSTCRHLIVTDNRTKSIIGTYRVRTIEAAVSAYGFYSASEFTLEDLPYEVLTSGLEAGRACIAKEHRNSRVLYLLWRGLSRIMLTERKRYIFGCCSLPTTDINIGINTYFRLVRDNYLHKSINVKPRKDFGFIYSDRKLVLDENAVMIPKLFSTYLRIGAKICGLPGLDSEFKTIDFFIVADSEDMPLCYKQMFFQKI